MLYITVKINLLSNYYYRDNSCYRDNTNKLKIQTMKIKTVILILTLHTPKSHISHSQGTWDISH